MPKLYLVHLIPGVRPTQTGFRVDYYERPKRHIRFLSLPYSRTFPTEQSARDWQDGQIATGARWFHPQNLVAGRGFNTLPDIKAWKSPEGALTLTVNGSTVVSGVTDPRTLAEAIRRHPDAKRLTPKVCRHCYAPAVMNFAEHRLTHLRKGCVVRLDVHLPTVPIALVMAVWNSVYHRIYRGINREKIDLINLVDMGILRPATNGEMTHRIQRVEVMEIGDEGARVLKKARKI